MPEPTTCIHCGRRIVLVNYALGPQWEHQHQGAAFQDARHWHCHTTVAAPPAERETTEGDAPC